MDQIENFQPPYKSNLVYQSLNNMKYADIFSNTVITQAETNKLADKLHQERTRNHSSPVNSDGSINSESDYSDSSYMMDHKQREKFKKAKRKLKKNLASRPEEIPWYKKHRADQIKKVKDAFGQNNNKIDKAILI